MTYCVSRCIDWVFPGRTPGTHTCPNHVGEVVSRLLGPGASAHSLRHRYATKAYAASHDLLAVQQLLGHSTPATTQGYVRVDMGDLRRAARAGVLTCQSSPPAPGSATREGWSVGAG